MAGATADEDDVELTEFSDEIEEWVIEEFAKIGLDTQKYFETRCRGFSKKNRPRRGNTLDVMRILKKNLIVSQ
jgi:N utilization substance protein A